MKTKTFIIIGAVVAVLVVAYFVFFKDKGTGTDAAAVPMGKKKDGTAYFQADVTKIVGNIKGSPDWLKSVQEKATTANRSLADQLQLDAIWMLDNA